MKQFTLENLRSDNACAPGMRFVTPLIESGEFTPEKLLAENEDWFYWALFHGYEGRELIADKCGPQIDLVIDLIQRARLLTGDESNRLSAARVAARVAARGADWDAAWDAAWVAARGAAWDAAGYVAGYAAWVAGRDTARGAARDAARGAARDAARGLMVRDLIGQHGFTQEHYDLITSPWRQTIGRIHPDDADMLALGEAIPGSKIP